MVKMGKLTSTALTSIVVFYSLYGIKHEFKLNPHTPEIHMHHYSILSAGRGTRER